MRSILETCHPRPDIQTGSFNPEIFTASLSQVVDCYRGRTTPTHTLYTDAEQFFRDAISPEEALGMAQHADTSVRSVVARDAVTVVPVQAAEISRVYASLEPSETRALASIRASLRGEQVAELLAATARKVVRSDAGTFEVQHDVTDPEHIPDRTRRPVLPLAALDADQVDVEAYVTTAGPNRPRLHQNFVFVLVPETVHVKGEVWSEDRETLRCTTGAPLASISLCAPHYRMERLICASPGGERTAEPEWL